MIFTIYVHRKIMVCSSLEEKWQCETISPILARDNIIFERCDQCRFFD